LLEVDLTDNINKTDKKQSIEQELDKVIQEVRELFNSLQKELELSIELLEPRLLLPSFNFSIGKLNFFEPDEFRFICGLIEKVFNVDIYNCFSSEDKELVNEHIKKVHGINITQYPSPKQITLDIMSSWIDWQEITLNNLFIGDYKINALKIDDFSSENLKFLYFKIVWSIVDPDTLKSNVDSFEEANSYPNSKYKTIDFTADFSDNMQDGETLDQCIKRGRAIVDDLKYQVCLIYEWREKEISTMGKNLLIEI